MRISYLKYFYILLIVFILSMLGSFAFFSWESGNSDNTNVSFDVVADTVYIYYDAGSNINGGDLYPTDDKNDGISKDITVKISGVVESKPVAFNLYLDLTDVPEELMDDSFKWALYNGSEELGTGSITKNITNCTGNNTRHIVLFSNNITTVEKQNYTLYLWIDGNMTNPDTMMNKSFKVNLHADGTNATLIEGNSMSLISLERNGGNNVNMTLQSLMYNFDSYAISGDGTTEPTSWTDMGCSDNSCNTNDRNVYQKTLNNVDLVYVNGLSYVWLKDVEGRIAKIEIGKNYIITLNNNSATTAGTTTIYGIYKDGFYKDSSYKEKYEINDKITVPTKTNYIFKGYYDPDDKMVIDSEGNFVSGMQSIYYDDITLNAKWVEIDKKAPTVSLINSSGGNWTNQNVNVTLNYSDDGSGINASSLQYSTDNINWTSIENTSLSGYTDTWYDERNSTVYYKICDNAGNCSTTSTIIKIDKTKPTVVSLENSSGGNWTNQNITVTLNYNDEGSGIDKNKLQWSYDGDTWTSFTDVKSDKSYVDSDNSAEGDRIAYYRIYDKAGNYTEVSTPIRINRSLKLSISKGTGVAAIYYKINNNSFASTTSDLSASLIYETEYSYYGVPVSGYYMTKCTKDSPCTGTVTKSISDSLVAYESVYQLYNSSGTSIGYTDNLGDAISNVSSGGTIQALKDNSYGSNSNIEINKSLTINTNGFTIGISKYLYIYSSPTIVINGGGTISCSIDCIGLYSGSFTVSNANMISSTAAAAYVEGGTFNLSSGTLEGTNGLYMNGGTANINGGKINGKTSQGIYASNSKVNITDGTIIGADVGIYTSAGGNVTVRPVSSVSNVKIRVETSGSNPAIINNGTIELGWTGVSNSEQFENILSEVNIDSPSGYGISNYGTVTHGSGVYTFNGSTASRSYAIYNEGTFNLTGGCLYFSDDSYEDEILGSTTAQSGSTWAITTGSWRTSIGSYSYQFVSDNSIISTRLRSYRLS